MINYYQLGGKTPDQQFVQELVESLIFGQDPQQAMLAIQQLALEQPKVLQQLFLIWLEAGIDGVINAIQQSQLAQKAAYGAKLNRIMALSNRCPSGYMKKGGKCKKCEEGQKINKNGVFHNKAGYFQNGALVKKKPQVPERKNTAPQDTTKVNKKPTMYERGRDAYRKVVPTGSIPDKIYTPIIKPVAELFKPLLDQSYFDQRDLLNDTFRQKSYR